MPNYGPPITDKSLLAQLNSGGNQDDINYGPPVTDPAILAQLNSPQQNNRDLRAQGRAMVNDFANPASIPEQSRKTFNAARNALSDIYQGVGEAGQNIASAFTRGYAPRVNMEDVFTRNNPNAIDEFIKESAKFGPFGAARTAAGRLAGGYAYGGTQSDNPVVAAPLTGAVNALAPLPFKALDKLGQGIGKVKGLLSGEPLFKSPLSPEQLSRNLEATIGTDTSLGDVIDNPFLKRTYENILTKIPFSGANEALQKTGKQIVDRGKSIVDKYLGNNDPLRVNEDLGNALKYLSKKETNIKNELYTPVNTLAEQNGISLNPSQFRGQAKKYKEAIEGMSLLKYEPDVKNLLNRVIRYAKPDKEIKSSILDKEGNQIITGTEKMSIKEGNILAGRLNTLANQYSQSPGAEDRAAASLLGTLGKSLKADINQTIEKSGNEELKLAFTTAEDNYKKNFSSFLDKDIYKFTHGNKSSDELIANFIKTGQSDKGQQLTKLMSKLPDKQKDLVKYAYFSRALEGVEGEEVVNPNKLATLWKKLGPNQKRALIENPEERRQLDNYVILTGKNSKALYTMLNPQTGQMSLDIIPFLLGGPMKTGAKIAASKPIVNYLTSEPRRIKTVNKLLKK